MRAEVVCADGVGLLMDYLEGILGAEQKSAIDGHLLGCARCTAFVKSYRETPRILREATLAAMPAELGPRLLGFLRSRTQGH